jgi:aromatic ring-opening dioxygenase LigB subunit
MEATIPRLAPAPCGLLPHAPILVPEVAGSRLERCERSSRACAELARRVVDGRPTRLFLVSPHAPRAVGAFGLFAGERVRGNLAEFGAARVKVNLACDRAAAAAISRACAAEQVALRSVPDVPLDHGSAVPLWFLVAAGWSGPTCVASLPVTVSSAACAAFGRAVGRAYAGSGGAVALIASGDMTHRASPGAPEGYDPRGARFDLKMTDLVRQGRLREVAALDPALRDAAAEDSVEPTTIVAAALGFEAHGAEVLSYEHPFGVGYLVAVFHDGGGR